jgi:hypothetical protein
LISSELFPELAFLALTGHVRVGYLLRKALFSVYNLNIAPRFEETITQI